MDATFQTKIKMSGNKEEIKKTIELIMSFQYKLQRAAWYFGEGTITINNSCMKLEKDLINDYFKNTEAPIQDKIIIELNGPYGEFDYLREIRFFEELSDALPSISFIGSFVGEETYSYESAEYQLANKKLYISQYYENYGESGELIKYVYDPIEHRYEDGQYTAADETLETSETVYTGSIQVTPFSLTIKGVYIVLNTSLKEMKDTGLTEDSLCIDEFENIRDYAINKPVLINGLPFFIVLRFSIETNEYRLCGIRMILDNDTDEKQKWTKTLIFALNTFGRPDTESINEVTFQGGEVEMSWDDDPRDGEESEEMVPIINYWGPLEDYEDF